jgi:hypothetical protein
VTCHRPPQIEPEIFYDELRFWNIDEQLIETFIEDDMVSEIFFVCACVCVFLSVSPTQTPLDDIRVLPVQQWRRLIWQLLTYPTAIHFPYGEVIRGLCILFTLLSCIPLMSE